MDFHYLTNAQTIIPKSNSPLTISPYNRFSNNSVLANSTSAIILIVGIVRIIITAFIYTEMLDLKCTIRGG